MGKENVDGCWLGEGRRDGVLCRLQTGVGLFL